MRRKTLFTAAFLAAVGLMVAFATSASAFTGISFATRCSNVGCHTVPGGANPVATQVSNNGTTAVYSVTSGGIEWALFNGATRVSGQVGATGQISVPVGASYTLFAVNGFPGPISQITVAPVAPVTQFNITATAGPNGAISPGSGNVNQGANATYTFTPSSGFRVANVLVDGVSVGAPGTHTFTNVQATHTVAVTFEPIPVTTFTLTPSAGPNGSISPATMQTVVSGSSLSFTITPSSGFRVANVLVDGVSVGAVGTYTFSNIRANHTITATFSDVAVAVPTRLSFSVNGTSIGSMKSIWLMSSLIPSVGPRVAGLPVRYEMKRPGSTKWVLVKVSLTRASGYSVSGNIYQRNRGLYQFRARFLGTDDYLPSTSKIIYVRVR